MFFTQPLSPLKPIGVGPQMVSISPTQTASLFCFICFCLVAQLEHVKTEGSRGGGAIFVKRKEASWNIQFHSLKADVLIRLDKGLQDLICPALCREEHLLKGISG